MRKIAMQTFGITMKYLMMVMSVLMEVPRKRCIHSLRS